jgi:hypothetical protein
VSVAYLTAYFSWPLIALGIACFVVLRWRKVHGYLPSNAIGIVAIGLVFVPILAIFVYSKATEANLLVEDLTFVPAGLTFFLLSLFIRRNAANVTAGPNIAATKKQTSARICNLIGGGMIFIGAYNVIGDFLRDRAEIDGVVARKYVTHGYRGSVDYHVEINGRSFPTTADVYERVDALNRVHATIGRASGTIFQATTVGVAPTADSVTGPRHPDKTSSF